MKYINATIFLNGSFVKGSFEVKNGRFGQIETGFVDDGFTNAGSSYATGNGLSTQSDITDLHGHLVIPGLIDLHGHGNSGYDFSTCDLKGLKIMARYLGRNGITSFAPASMTMSYERLAQAFSNAAALKALQDDDAIKSVETGVKNHTRNRKETIGMSRLVGINMEGPYFSYGKKGAQDPRFLKAPDFDGFRRLFEGCDGLIRIVDVAPELDGAMEFIRRAGALCTVSIAHTEADYETVLAAFAEGASQITHLFNGMNGIHHRAPGPVCAAYDTPGVFAELICDGIHIAPPVIRMVFELFKGRVILISDALAGCGMPDGCFTLGDQKVTLKDHHATLPDGTLAGSASNLFDMLRNVVSFGIPLEEAILSATLNPARQLGLASELGSIEEGKKADFLICSESLQLESVYIGGVPISGSETCSSG